VNRVPCPKVLQLKLTYFGHVAGSDGLEKRLMFEMGNGRSGGRPRRRWMDEVVETTSLRLQQLKEAARDRVGWKDVVRVVTKDVCVPMQTSRWNNISRYKPKD